jgi:alanine-glyoxylate transaminase/serine-glyoxylate transaminase/serine-pyruvate transaminase
MDRPVIDHRGPEFGKLGHALLQAVKSVFKTQQSVVIYPSSGTGAWEAALVNTLSPHDKVLMVETGQFATLWAQLAQRLGLDVQTLPTDWRRGADPAAIEARLADDKSHSIKAVCIVHNETSTGCVSDVRAVREAMDRANHPALYLVDTISSLASIDYRMDEWGVDVTVAGSQKGLMLPPGLAFNGVSEKALAASKHAMLPRAYWSWDDQMRANKTGFFPYTPATNLLFGLREAIDMLHEEGLDRVFARHARHAKATRAAVEAWGLDIVCLDPKAYSNSLTGVIVPQGASADAFRQTVLDAFDMSLGTGLGRFADKIFRIGHLGYFNDLMLAGTLVGVEMGLARSGIAYERGGVQAALDLLESNY